MASNCPMTPSKFFKNDEHPKSMIKQMHSCWSNGKYSDVTIQIDEHSIKSHKIVLASLSEYFRGLFDMTDIESEERSQKNGGEEVYVLKDVDYNSFQLLLNYAYTGEVKISAENAQDLLICANYFGIIAVKHACEDFMSTNIDFGNCIDLSHFAHAFSLSRLEGHVLDFVGENLEMLMDTDEFLSIPFETFINLCQKIDLVILRKRVPLPAKIVELCLLKAALRYTENKPETEREMSLSGILKVIRLPLIDKTKLREEFNKYQDLAALPSVKKLIELAADPDSSSVFNLDIPPFWKSSRKFSKQKIVKGMRYLACGNQVGYPEKSFNDSKQVDFDDHIQQIIVWTRRWDGRPVVSGIQMKYSSGKVFKYGRKSTISNLFVGEHVVNLEEGEVITKVTGGHGYLVDSLTFHTNLGRALGPYGGPGGGRFSESPPSKEESRRIYDSSEEEEVSHSESDEEPPDFRSHFNLTPDFNFGNLTVSKKKEKDDVIHGYLHAVVCGEVNTQSEVALTHFGFVWIQFDTVTSPPEEPLPSFSPPKPQNPKGFKNKLLSKQFYGKRRGAR